MAVYLMRMGASGDVKIGVAKAPLVRMRQLQTSLPVKLRLIRVLDGGHDLERALHARFAANRKAGEWFAYTPEMAGDLGAPDMPIPRPKRGWEPDMATAAGRYRALLRDLFECIGGKDALARSLAIPPWVVTDWNTNPLHLSALVLLARQAGMDVTFRDALDAQVARDREREVDERGRAEADASAQRADMEKAWIAQHGADAAWWALLPQHAKPVGAATDEPAPTPAPAPTQTAA